MIFQKKSKFLPFFLISIFYLIINYLFNFSFWRIILFKIPINALSAYGEWPYYEYVAEIVRLNILGGRNPFEPVFNVLYPFGWSFVLEDAAPINGLYFLLFRQFFTVHQSFTFIVLIGMFLSNIIMYIFLRILGISRKVSFLIGLVFGFSPFVVIRFGQPTYTALYLFPLIGIFIVLLLKNQNKLILALYAILLGIAMAITVLTNLYFTLMIGIFSLILIMVYFLLEKRSLIRIFKERTIYFILSIFTAIILLWPWFIKAYDVMHLKGVNKLASWVDSISYSSDLFGLFTLGYFNPFYGKVFEYLSTFFINKANFENFVYPGFLILFSLFYFIFFRKNLSNLLVNKIKPLFVTCVIFWILTLGPFLHIFGVRLPIPLPYALIEFIPFAQFARSPGRFIVIFIFLGSVIAALIFDEILKNKLKMRIAKMLFVLNLFLIFFLDQSYTAVVPPPYYSFIPYKIYQHLQSQGKGPLFEVPFVIRDGLKSQGDYNSVWLPLAQLIHKQQSFSLYGGRIDDDVFSYYKKNPLFSTFGRILEKPDFYSNKKIDDFDLEKIKESIEFFGIENTLLRKDEIYTNISFLIFNKLGFKEILSDQGYLLLHKDSNRQEFVEFNLNDKNRGFQLGQGWGEREPTGRWVIGKVADILFKINESVPVKLKFTAYSLAKDQKATFYLNGNKIEKISIGDDLHTYTLNIDSNIRNGINILTFTFNKTIQPAKLIEKSQDLRPLSVYFTEVNIEKNDLLIKNYPDEYRTINFSANYDDRFLLQGWSTPEKGGRWTEGKQAKVFFKINKVRPLKLRIKAIALDKPQKAKIFFNNQLIGLTSFKNGEVNDYSLNLKDLPQVGLNLVSFEFAYTQQPKKVIKNNKDSRNLSLNFKYLALED